MGLGDYRRSLANVRLLLELGVERGIAVPDLLENSRIEAARIDDPNHEIQVLQELRVIENLLRALRRPAGLGLALGLRYRLTTFGIWGYAVISSPTVGDAIGLGMRFMPLTFASSAIRFALEGDLAMLEFTAPALAPSLQRFLVHRDMAASAALMAQTIGDQFRLIHFDLRDEAAGFNGGAGEGADWAAGIAGADLRLGRAVDRLTFDRRFLAQRLPQADAATARQCERLCAELMERRRERLSASAWVAYYLCEQGQGRLPSLDGAARLAGTSARTLKRRLQAEGTSFRALAAQAQAQEAAHLVLGGDASVAEIAEQLGYADLSAFSQAFKRWHGLSPLAYRSRARGGADGDARE